MAIKVIEGYNDSMFPEYEDRFYSNFCPDDWDYIIVGDGNDGDRVERLAEKLMICDYDMAQIDGEWIAVTYHS